MFEYKQYYDIINLEERSVYFNITYKLSDNFIRFGS